MKLARTVVVLFVLEIALVAALAVVVAAIPSGGSFGAVESGAMPHQRMLLRLFALQPLVIRMWWLRLPLHAAAVAFFIAWLYRTHRSRAGTAMKSHWAITGWFVPFLNFVMPYRVVRDVWRNGAPPIVIAWWSVVVLEALGFLAATAFAAAGMIRARPMELNWLAIADYSVEIVLAALFIAVVAAVEARVHGAPLFGRLPLIPSAAAATAAAALVLTASVFAFYQVRGRWAHNYLSSTAVGMEEVESMAPPPQMLAAIAPPPRPVDDGMPVEGGVEGGVLGGVTGGVVGGVVTDAPPPPPPPVRPASLGTPPRVLHRVEPAYPEVARRARIQGIVIVQVSIDKTGAVTSVKVIKPLPFGLDQAAVEAVRQWRFAPPDEERTFLLTISFRLTKGDES